MAEQEIQVSEEQTRQKGMNDMNQNKSNNIRKITIEDENSEGDKSGTLDKNKIDTSSNASTGETVDVAISIKKIKNTPNNGPKEDDDYDPYDPYVKIFNFIQTFIFKLTSFISQYYYESYQKI
jgi:hypothetical protein